MNRKSGIELIAAERERQITQEKWTPEHDDQHPRGELACAAVCYAMPPHTRDATREFRSRGADDRLTMRIQTLLQFFWPWEIACWKPSAPENRIRELVKAGALICAEIDRLQRKKERES